MDSESKTLPSWALFRLLLWVHWRSFCARIRAVRHQSPLVLLVLALFIFSYLGAGYWIFREGFSYLYRFPLLGGLLVQRILYLIFAFFFLMLAFSNLIIGYTTMFKNREAQWFLTLPVAHLHVYRWKFVEALAISSWALLFLCAPLVLAYGRQHDADCWFYLLVSLSFIPFVVLPALLGSWGILLLVRFIPRYDLKKILFGLGTLVILLLFIGIKPMTDGDVANTQAVVSFDRLLQHTRLSQNSFLPSSWLARGMIMWAEGVPRQAGFYFLLLLSYALMGIWIGFIGVGRLFYGSWSQSLSAQAERFQLQSEAIRLRGERYSWFTALAHRLREFSPPVCALVLKDFRLFWRDPTQWIQFMIFFGLLCIYVINLRNVALTFESPFWEAMVSYLNLAASALTLSTLTTRFVFPQFSLEGRRLWILGLAPLGLRKVLLQKFWMSYLVAMNITVWLMIIASRILHLDWLRVLFFCASIALMSASLTGLAVGLGALFPNFKEDNPSKIVSGFGGTLCLVLSFVYIGVFVGLCAIPEMRRVSEFPLPLPDWLAITIPLLVSLLVLFVPMRMAIRKVEAMEI